jgi:phosphate transport system permease protein
MKELFNQVIDFKSPKNKAAQEAFPVIFKLCLLFTLFILGLIFLYILWNGLQLFLHVNPLKFFFGLDWEPVNQKKFGIFPMILSSFFITFASTLISAPIGIMCAIFSAEMAKGALQKAIQASVQILAGTPSVVFGLLGLTIITPWIQTLSDVSGLSMLAAIIILSIMILPTIVSISQDAISSVPKEIKQASLALGATSFQTIFKVILPFAKPGIVTSIVLAISRAFGEAMAVKMVIGNIQTMPNFSQNTWFGLLSPARTLTTNIIGDIEYAREGLHLQALFATGAVLFVAIMLANYIAYRIRYNGGLK